MPTTTTVQVRARHPAGSQPRLYPIGPASDIRRFDEILADDFLCSNPDGSLIDRAAFLKQTAAPVAISNLEARDVVIRIMGDVAIIHARTTYMRPDGTEGRRPVHGRVGPSRGPLARRLRSRHALLTRLGRGRARGRLDARGPATSPRTRA